MSTPYQMSDTLITIFLPEGPKQIERTTHAVAKIRELAGQEATDEILDQLRDLCDPATQLATLLDGSGVEIDGNVVSYKGKRLPKHLEDRIRDLLANGLDIGPWKRFVARLWSNPEKRARDELAKFLEGAGLPITEDGCFLAYKRVRPDYTDVRTGTFDNSIGQTPTMPRADVDPDAYKTCSTGLHFCSKGYLASFTGGADSHIMIVKVDPADVVAIPADHSNQKGRAWKYEVVGEIDTTDNGQKHEWGIAVAPAPVFDPAPAVDDLIPDDEVAEWEDAPTPDPVPEGRPDAFVKPVVGKRSVWRKLGDLLN